MDGQYITLEGARNLPHYRYHSSDPSLVYNYFLSPVADFLVSKLPESISPNCITLCGHFCILGLYVLTITYCYQCALPSWLIYTCGVLYFAWLILDNMDGKQARRTGTSSPLGLIFDHQVDALNTWMTTTFMGVLFQFSGTEWAIWIWIVTASPFYFATWEEYHLGRLDLPMINGVSDGCMIAGLIIFITGILGPDYMTIPWSALGGFALRDLFFIFFAISATFTVAGNVFNVAAKTKRQDGFESLMSWLIIIAAVILIKIFSPVDLTIEYNFSLMAFLGFIFAKDCALLQFGHVTEGKFNPSKINQGLIAALVIHTLLAFGNLTLIPEAFFLHILTCLSFGNYLYMIVVGTAEITSALDIPILAMPTKGKKLTSN